MINKSSEIFHRPKHMMIKYDMWVQTEHHVEISQHGIKSSILGQLSTRI